MSNREFSALTEPDDAAVPSPDGSDVTATEAVKQAAAAAGFGLCGIAAPTPIETLNHFHTWLDAGYAGEMGYLERRRSAYADPEMVLSAVRSVVVVAMDYRTSDPAQIQAGFGKISRYAWGQRDYHDVVREKLKRVADVLHERVPGCRSRAVVDTAPILERDVARRAGLGWFGKNTMLISKHRGSYFFLGALLTDAELVVDAPHETSHCGTCTACLDACPTDAFVEPYVLDARRCISYLTIELQDEQLPTDLENKLDGWVFGCDVCQDVCPWNSKSKPSQEPAFEPRTLRGEPADVAEAGLVSLSELLALDEQQFLKRFGGTPIERTGLAALQRNARAVLTVQKDDR